MTTRNEIYKCGVCGNITTVMHASGGTLSCCGQPMNRMNENIVDAALEKHVPVITKTADGYMIAVGSVEHPMEEKHFIEWIELIAGNERLIKYLKPGDKPVATFKTDATEVYAREYCNLHGNWRSK